MKERKKEINKYFIEELLRYTSLSLPQWLALWLTIHAMHTTFFHRKKTLLQCTRNNFSLS